MVFCQVKRRLSNPYHIHFFNLAISSFARLVFFQFTETENPFQVFLTEELKRRQTLQMMDQFDIVF
jgi:hypothetical protein